MGLGKTKVMPKPLNLMNFLALKREGSFARNLNLPSYTFCFITHNDLSKWQPKTRGTRLLVVQESDSKRA